MADYLVTDTELTAVADAIREKGDTSAVLEWPNGYVSAVEDIETGGGVEMASVTLTAVKSMLPSHIYYTDSSMAVQHVTTGGVRNTLMPVGSIIFCYSSNGPAMSENVGITALYELASGRTLYAAYEVTG